MICTEQSFKNVPLLISFLCTLSTAYYYKVKPTWMVKSCPWMIFREETQTMSTDLSSASLKHGNTLGSLCTFTGGQAVLSVLTQLFLFCTSILYFQCPSSIEFPLPLLLSITQLKVLNSTSNFICWITWAILFCRFLSFSKCVGTMYHP